MTALSQVPVPYVERILLVCGLPNAGKSRLIREMYSDDRLAGQYGIGSAGPLPVVKLSRERWLAGRSTSPHEFGDDPESFHSKIVSGPQRSAFRLNYVSAVQPDSRNQMPDIVGTCGGLISSLNPERIRVVSLSPDQYGTTDSQLSQSAVNGLRSLNIEYCCIDATRSNHRAEPGNVRLLADFFDFS